MAEETEIEKIEKRQLPADVVAKMKDAGLPKPDDVTQACWNQVQNVRPNHMSIAYMAASGATNIEIAEAIGMTKERVGVVIGSEKVKLEIARIQHRMFGNDVAKTFNRILPKAIFTAEGIMDDSTVKATTRLNAAQDFMDRAVGKPTQRVEVGGNLLRQLYEKMDSESKVIDVGGDKPLEDLLETEAKKFSPETLQTETPDQWVAENLK